jgi:hypothetical protein
MKRILLLAVMLPFILVSCFRGGKHDKLCTMVFVSVQISVRDSLNNPVRLDSYEVRVSGTNSLLPVQSDSASMAQGIYTLVTDSQLNYIAEKGTELRFTGYRNNKDTVNSVYIVNQDGCHVYLVSGADPIIVQ